MRRVGNAERRARLAGRHLLSSAKAETPLEVARALVALHSTGAAAVYLSIWARTRGAGVGDVDRALYEDHSLVRVMGMRRTVFAVPAELVPVVQAACGSAIADREWRRLAGYLALQGIGSGAEWLERVAGDTLAALRSRGQATAAELAQDVPELRHRLRFGEGTAYAADQGLSTRVVGLLAMRGRIVRGRPRGSWLSAQYRWEPAESWFPGGIPGLGVEEAQRELARWWLRAYGPGTRADLQWWAGWAARETASALAGAGAVEVELESGRGYLLPGDLEPVPAPPPAAALLPALDSSVMGWRERDWYLGPHRAPLFDRSGNAGPTVWWDGRVVGGWGQRGREVVFRLLEDAGSEAVRAVAAEAERLQGWLSGTRVVPPFRTPLERSLED